MMFFKEEYDSHYWSELGKFIHNVLLSQTLKGHFIAEKISCQNFYPSEA